MVCIHPLCGYWMSCVCFLVSICNKGHLARVRVLPSQSQEREVETQCLHFVDTAATTDPHPISHILNPTELWKPQVLPIVTKSLGKLEPNWPDVISLYLSVLRLWIFISLIAEVLTCLIIVVTPLWCCLMCSIGVTFSLKPGLLTSTSGLRDWGKRLWVLL